MPLVSPSRKKGVAYGLATLGLLGVSAFVASRFSKTNLEGQLDALVARGVHTPKNNDVIFSDQGHVFKWMADAARADEWVEHALGKSTAGYLVDSFRDPKNGKDFLVVDPYDRTWIRQVTEKPWFASWGDPLTGMPIPNPQMVEVRIEKPSNPRRGDEGGEASYEGLGSIHIYAERARKTCELVLGEFFPNTFDVNPDQRKIGAEVNALTREMKRNLDVCGVSLESLVRKTFEDHEIGHNTSSGYIAPQIHVLTTMLPPANSPFGTVDGMPRQALELTAELMAAKQALRSPDVAYKNAYALMQIIFSIKGGSGWATRKSHPEFAWLSPYAPDGAIFLKHGKKDAAGTWSFDFAAIEADIERTAVVVKQTLEQFDANYIKPHVMHALGLKTENEFQATFERDVRKIMDEKSIDRRQAAFQWWDRVFMGLSPEQMRPILTRAVITESANFQRAVANVIGFESVNAQGTALSAGRYLESILLRLK